PRAYFAASFARHARWRPRSEAWSRSQRLVSNQPGWRRSRLLRPSVRVSPLLLSQQRRFRFQASSPEPRFRLLIAKVFHVSRPSSLFPRARSTSRSRAGRPSVTQQLLSQAVAEPSPPEQYRSRWLLRVYLPPTQMVAVWQQLLCCESAQT